MTNRHAYVSNSCLRMFIITAKIWLAWQLVSSLVVGNNGIFFKIVICIQVFQDIFLEISIGRKNYMIVLSNVFSWQRFNQASKFNLELKEIRQMPRSCFSHKPSQHEKYAAYKNDFWEMFSSENPISHDYCIHQKPYVLLCWTKH